MNGISFFQHRTFLPQQEADVGVQFHNEVPREELWERIKSYESPKVIFWYIGSHGLKSEGVQYHRKDLSVCTQNGAECILFDLTAWGALTDKKCRLNGSNQNVDRINSFGIQQIKAISSNHFFAWMETHRDPYFSEVILNRSFVYEKSTHFRPNGIKLGELLENKLFQPLLEKDTAQCYSMLQYLEAIYLVEKLVVEGGSNIIFALPNDEWKYYFDTNRSFETDIKHHLQEIGVERPIRIEFCTFLYGDDLTKRPYLEGKKVIKSIQQPDL